MGKWPYLEELAVHLAFCKDTVNRWTADKQMSANKTRKANGYGV